MRIPILCLLIFLALGLQSKAQSNALEKAARLESKRNLSEALDIYLRLADKGNAEAMARLGNIHLKLKDYKAAKEWLDKAALAGAESPQFCWDRAQLYLNLDSLQQAMEWFLEYSLQSPNGERGEKFIDFLIDLPEESADTSEYLSRRLSFNSSHADYAPAWYLDGILFTSERPNMDLGVEYVSAVTGLPHTNVYHSREREEGKWSKAKGLDQVFNTRFNEGAAAMHPDSQSIYFTRTTIKKKAGDGPARMQILVLERDGDKWSEPKIGTLKPRAASFAYPAVSPDGKYLYFASDMDGGFGGMDLYRSTINTNGFGAPENLGPQINSPGNDIFPSLPQNGLLCFTSDGHPGRGGLDIFYAYQVGGEWKPAQNMGLPINSSWDDLSYIATPDGSRALLASNRHSHSRDYDIFEFFIPEPEFEDCRPQEEPVYCFSLFEKGSVDSLPYQLSYQWDLGDGSQKTGVHIRHCYSDTGTYRVTLHAIDSITRDTVLVKSSYTLRIALPVQAKVTAPDTALHKTSLEIDAASTHLPDVDVRKYEWDFGDGKTAEGMSVAHTYAKPGDYEIRLGVRGVNKLTGARVNHCITKPIHILHKKTKWTPTAFKPDPLERPFTPSRDTLGNTSNRSSKQEPPKDHVLLQKTKLPDTTRPPGKGLYPPANLLSVRFNFQTRYPIPMGAKLILQDVETGNTQLEKHIPPGSSSLTAKLPTGGHYNYYVQIPGFFPNFGTINSKKLNPYNFRMAIEIEENLKLVSMDELADTEMRMTLENIFFEPNNARLLPESVHELSTLLRFLREHPDLAVEIEGHTDAHGPDHQNQTLSERRAAAVVGFLALNGIGLDRLSSSGFGESQPRATNDTEEGRALNRRVELKIQRLK